MIDVTAFFLESTGKIETMLVKMASFERFNVKHVLNLMVMPFCSDETLVLSTWRNMRFYAR